MNLKKFIIFNLVFFALFFRYVEVFNINIFYLFYIFYIFIFVIYQNKENKILIHKIHLFIFLLIVFVLFQLVYLGNIRIASLFLFISALLGTIIGYYIAKNNHMFYFFKYVFILEIIHISLAGLQKITGFVFIIPSYVLGFAEQFNNLYFIRPPGLSIIPAYFHLNTLFLVSYFLIKKNKIYLLLLVIAISLINFSKIYIPMILIYVLFIYPLIKKYNKKGKIIKSTILFFLGILILNIIGLGYGYIEYLKNPTASNTFVSRGLYIVYTKFFISEHPLIGIGLDNFKSSVEDIAQMLQVYAQVNNPHNIFLKFISELGLVGFSILFIFIVFVVYHLNRALFYAEMRGLERYYILMTINILFFILSISSFHNFHFHNNLYIWLGIALGVIHITYKMSIAK